MVATSPESEERFGRGSDLFMESAPVRVVTGSFPDGYQLVRRIVIAASTATIVYALAELLIGLGVAG